MEELQRKLKFMTRELNKLIDDVENGQLTKEIERVFDSLRGLSVISLGCDAFCRKYWLLRELGVIIVEPLDDP